MKTHLNLTTADLEKSVQFYAALLHAEPAKVLNDYALFITDQPGLELALDLSDSVSACADAHYGVCVGTPQELESAIDRLERAGLALSIEREETCCYANQSKVWAVDPDGRRWEVYAVHYDTQKSADEGTTCCSTSDAGGSSCCAA